MYLKNIFITSHINADLDALASAISFAKFIKENFNSKVKVVLSNFDKTTQRVFNSFDEQFKKTYFISEKDALNEVVPKSALIILDTNQYERTQAIDLIEKIDRNSLFIIDHHRIGKKIPDISPKNSYFDINASSTSEIIVEFIRFFLNDGRYKNFAKFSTILLSGIYLDTNQLTRTTSPRTYDSVSWLIKNGADELEAAHLNQDSLKQMGAYYSKVFTTYQELAPNVVFVCLDEKDPIGDDMISSLCDSLLSFKDVNAGFILAKTSQGFWKLSARSNKKFNVQYVMEKLGGGGHFNAAATSFQETMSSDEIKKMLQKEIKAYLIQKEETFERELNISKKISEKKALDLEKNPPVKKVKLTLRKKPKEKEPEKRKKGK